MAWQQVYNPLNSVALSTLFAALPVVVLLGTLAILRIKAHWAAILGLTREGETSQEQMLSTGCAD